MQKATLKLYIELSKETKWDPLYKIHNSDETANLFQNKKHKIVSSAVPPKNIHAMSRFPFWLTK